MVVVESSKCSVKSVEGILRENVQACGITEVKKGVKGFDDVHMDKTVSAFAVMKKTPFKNL